MASGFKSCSYSWPEAKVAHSGGYQAPRSPACRGASGTAFPLKPLTLLPEVGPPAPVSWLRFLSASLILWNIGPCPQKMVRISCMTHSFAQTPTDGWVVLRPPSHPMPSEDYLVGNEADMTLCGPLASYGWAPDTVEFWLWFPHPNQVTLLTTSLYS